MISLQEASTHFEAVKWTSDGGFDCRCAVHRPDNHPSAHVKMGNKGLIARCKSCGATGKEIFPAAGISLKDVFLDKPSYSSSGERYVKSKYPKCTLYEYHSFIDGSYDHTKIRYYPERMKGKKQFANGYWSGERFVDKINCLKDRKPQTAIFGNVSLIKQCISENKTVFYCEGEKDQQTMECLGYPAFTQGSCTTFHKELAPLLNGIRLIILADYDSGGQDGANKVRNCLLPYAEEVKIITPCIDFPGADVTDYFRNHDKSDFENLINGYVVTESRMDAIKTNIHVGGTRQQDNTQLQKPGLSQDEVKELLAYKIDFDKDGNEKSKKVLQTVRNFEIIMDNDRRFVEKIKFDEFSQQTFLMGTVPWESPKNNYRAWSSYDDSALFSILQSDYGMNSRNDYFDAINNVAMRHKFHPLKDILDSLKWDGLEHIRGLLPDYLGVKDTEYSYQVMRLWMTGATSRVYCPGGKFDYTMIIKGRQGLGKSTFFQLLALDDKWFNDSLDSLDGDKAAQSLLGSWIVELAELKSLARTAGGVDSVKRFLSARQDKIRLPYSRRTDIFLRQCVFAGTTNKDDFLQDETGNRRFLIVEAGVNEPKKSLFTPDAIKDFKAAWAQAVHIWKNEKPKLLLPDSCKREAEKLQEESMTDDGKVGIITEYLSGKQRTCAIEIWQEALKESGRPAKWQASEINNIILSLPDWKRMSNPAKFGSYGSQRGFQKCSLQTQDKDVTKEECSQDFMEVSYSELSGLPFD